MSWSDEAVEAAYSTYCVKSGIFRTGERDRMGLMAMRAALEAADAVRSRTEVSVPTSVLDTPFSIPEIVEVGKAIFPHIGSEETTNIGAISHDAVWAVRKIFRDRLSASGGNRD